MRQLLVAAIVIAGCSSSSAPAKREKCTDLDACMAACAPCRTGTCSQTAGWQCFQLGKLRLQGQPPQFDIAEAAKTYEAGCKSYAPACAALALQVQDGRGVDYDAKRAIDLYQRACDQGAGIGCFNIGVMYEGGVGVPRDEAKARELFAKAMELYQGECKADPGWCSNIGYLYEHPLGGNADYARAAPVYADGCKRGDLDSCVSYANLQAEGVGGIPKDHDAAVATYDKMCTAGSGIACSNLAYDRDPDNTKLEVSAPLIERACDLGFSHACGQLAALMISGKLGNADRVRALMRRGCDLGAPMPCVMAADDLVVDPATVAPAAVLYERACHIGEPAGCARRASLSYQGKAPGDAIPWVQAACRQGDDGACQVLLGPR